MLGLVFVLSLIDCDVSGFSLFHLGTDLGFGFTYVVVLVLFLIL